MPLERALVVLVQTQANKQRVEELHRIALWPHRAALGPVSPTVLRPVLLRRKCVSILKYLSKATHVHAQSPSATTAMRSRGKEDSWSTALITRPREGEAQPSSPAATCKRMMDLEIMLSSLIPPEQHRN